MSGRDNGRNRIRDRVRDRGHGRSRPREQERGTRQENDQRPRRDGPYYQSTPMPDNRHREVRSPVPRFERRPFSSTSAGEYRGQPSSSSQSNDAGYRSGYRWGGRHSHDERSEPQQQDSLPSSAMVPTESLDVPSKQGNKGVIVNLEANYFKILQRPNRLLYQYTVDFSPAIEIRSLKSGLLFSQIKQFQPSLFDGTMLYLTVKLEHTVTEFVTMSNRDQQPYQIKVALVGLVSPHTPQYLQVCSIVLRKCEKALGLQLIGRNYYDMESKIELHQHRIQLWPGYITSIRQHEKEVMMCVEIATKVMRTDTVYDMLQDFLRSSVGDYKINFLNRIIGVTVLTTYNNKTYMISDVDFEESPQSMFDLKNGVPTSYINYFHTKFGVQIKDGGQPMLISRPSEREQRAGMTSLRALVPELCLITGFDDSQRKNFGLMRQVANATGATPLERIRKIKRFIQRLDQKTECQQILKDWNFRPDSELLKLNGRVLPSETIYFHNNREFRADSGANWSQSLHKNRMFRTVNLHNWALIYPQNDARCTSEFVRTLRRVAGPMGFQMNDPHVFTTRRDHSTDYVTELNNAIRQDTQLIVCVLPSARADLYSAIKKICCIEYAKPSQVLVRNTITPKPGKTSSSLMSVATKVAIQINTKLGGVPWMVQMNLRGLMAIGFDVCHDTLDKNKKSYGAMVCTMDLTETENSRKYFSTVSAHNNNTELSNDFALNVRKAMYEYQGVHGTKPENILIYRDGVGEGQIEHVKEHEIKNILAALRQDYGDMKIPLTFIVVTKRINTRFFRSIQGRKENPSAGTVVDDVVTLPERNDFFLVSQQVTHGTVSPTSYNIVHNKMGKSADTLQRLTYKLTHLYYNYSGPLAVPAVCQYAKKLAFMVGNYLHATPNHDNIKNTLYFL